jgi:hypothetical protein
VPGGRDGGDREQEKADWRALGAARIIEVLAF